MEGYICKIIVDDIMVYEKHKRNTEKSENCHANTKRDQLRTKNKGMRV